MTEPLLTISTFARAVGLSPSALRFYDDAGLLPPAEVDERTGYRYYTPGLERRAHMIRQMREVGVPVETMRHVLEGPPARATEILKGFARGATETARRTEDAVAAVISSVHAEGASVDPVVVTIDGPELASALRRVATAADSEPGSMLGVVLLDIAGADLTIAATNRYWLARWSISLGTIPVGDRRIVTPVKAVEDLVRWLSRQGTVTLSAGGSETRLTGDIEDWTILTEPDRFPAYRLIFDAQPPPRGRATVDRAQLLATAKDPGTTVVVRVGRDRLAVGVEGASEGTHLLATTRGEPITLGFSSSMLQSALTALVGTHATLSYATAEQAVQLTSPDQRSFTALIMPSVLTQ